MIKVHIDEVNIIVTQNAINEIKLIAANDFTTEGLVFRLKVDGKGCGGFDYAAGFSEEQSDDLIYIVKDGENNLEIRLDPFTAFYSKEGTLDYIKDFQNDTEGFHFENDNEKKYRGKFFKNEQMTPEGWV